MKYEEKNKAVLLLEDGTQFTGYAVGKIGTTSGEIAFNTGMTGYQEIFTDPSYFGQILVMTPSHIGNYGAIAKEVESDNVNIAGLVCKEFSDEFSRYGEAESLQTYFENKGVVGIDGVDTRALVRYIRKHGAMNAIISSDDKSIDELKEMMKAVPSMEGLELASRVSTKASYEFNTEGKFKVAVLDYGVKRSILTCLEERGCKLTVFPYNATFEEVMAINPDGFMLSNGPGDPEPLKESQAVAKQIIESGIPTFGICLGHQILSLASDLKTRKMHNGHRGVNHPIKNLVTGLGEITSQNHGFVVDEESVSANDKIEVTHMHLNDNTIAGIKRKDYPVFSVQYHPEASAGPHDSRYLFDEFIDLMKK